MAKQEKERNSAYSWKEKRKEKVTRVRHRRWK
jgi:hypothetical protein